MDYDPMTRMVYLRVHALPEDLQQTFQMVSKAEGKPQAIGVVCAVGMAAAEEGLIALLRRGGFNEAADWLVSSISVEMENH